MPGSKALEMHLHLLGMFSLHPSLSLRFCLQLIILSEIIDHNKIEFPFHPAVAHRLEVNPFSGELHWINTLLTSFSFPSPQNGRDSFYPLGNNNNNNNNTTKKGFDVRIGHVPLLWWVFVSRRPRRCDPNRHVCFYPSPSLFLCICLFFWQQIELYGRRLECDSLICSKENCVGLRINTRGRVARSLTHETWMLI